MDKKNNFKNIKKGSFTKQAQRAGLSVNRFTDKVLKNKDDFQKVTEKRAVLAKNFAKMRKMKKMKKSGY
tara:strand:+ start:304 stop:510 length:207 start_codon:yes stop_codon:yes gene_type:complete